MPPVNLLSYYQLPNSSSHLHPGCLQQDAKNLISSASCLFTTSCPIAFRGHQLPGCSNQVAGWNPTHNNILEEYLWLPQLILLVAIIFRRRMHPDGTRERSSAASSSASSLAARNTSVYARLRNDHESCRDRAAWLPYSHTWVTARVFTIFYNSLPGSPASWLFKTSYHSAPILAFDWHIYVWPWPILKMKGQGHLQFACEKFDNWVTAFRRISASTLTFLVVTGSSLYRLGRSLLVFPYHFIPPSIFVFSILFSFFSSIIIKRFTLLFACEFFITVSIERDPDNVSPSR